MSFCTLGKKPDDQANGENCQHWEHEKNENVSSSHCESHVDEDYSKCQKGEVEAAGKQRPIELIERGIVYLQVSVELDVSFIPVSFVPAKKNIPHEGANSPIEHVPS